MAFRDPCSSSAESGAAPDRGASSFVGRLCHWRYDAAQRQFLHDGRLSRLLGLPGREPVALDLLLSRLQPDDREALLGFLASNRPAPLTFCPIGQSPHMRLIRFSGARLADDAEGMVGVAYGLAVAEDPSRGSGMDLLAGALESDEAAASLAALNEELQAEIEERVCIEAELYRQTEEMARQAQQLQETNETLEELALRLQESELRYRSYVQNLPGVAFRCRADFTPELIAGRSGITGYPIEDFLTGKLHWLDLVLEEDRPRLQELIEAANADRGSSVAGDYRVRTRDGGIRWVCMHISRIQTPRVDEEFYDGIILDVTRQHQAEEALRASEERYRALIEQASFAIYVCDGEGRLREVNGAACRSLGYTRDELLQLKVADVDAVPLERSAPDGLRQMVADGPVTLQCVHRRKDGSLFPVEVRVGTIELNGQTMMLGIVQDITERQRLQALAAIRARQLDVVVQSVPQAIALLDREMRYLLVNRGWIEQYGLAARGFTTDNVIGRCHYDVFPEIGDDWREIHRRCLAGATEAREDDAFPRADGTTDWVRWVVTPWYEEEGAVGGLLMYTEIVTERHEIEEQLRQGQKMQAVGLLAGGIAHDFNNQLVGMLGYADMLVSDLADDPRSRRYAEQIAASARRASLLIHKLLDFARKGPERLETVDLHHIIGEVVAFLTYGVGKKVQVTQELDAERPLVRGDPVQLQSALLNVAMNAADAMPDGGALVFRTSVCLLGETEVRRLRIPVTPGEYVAVEVEDAGCGMPPEVLARIFEPFFTTKGPQRGTGMGLPSVYGTVETHRGSLAVESTPGVGTRFRIYLPVLSSENGAESDRFLESAERQATASPSGLRVLVVDDESSVREFAQVLLQRMGCCVTLCEGGAEALSLLRELRAEVDVVLLDLVMPAVSGREVLAALRELEADLPVVVMSGQQLERERRQLVQLGARAFLSKPFDSATLNSALQLGIRSKA